MHECIVAVNVVRLFSVRKRWINTNLDIYLSFAEEKPYNVDSHYTLVPIRASGQGRTVA